jgi:hypothetical protein
VGLTNVAGVFSRYFIVGFFLPAFFTLVVLAQLVSDAFLPNVYVDGKPAGQIAIVGGAALLLGLVLLGLNHPVVRLYEGYPLQAACGRPRRGRLGRLNPLRWLHALLMWRQHRRLSSARAKTQGEEVFQARWELDQRFPQDDESLLLPTTFGNAVRAFERHGPTRWQLNTIGAWPAIEMLLTEQEAQVHADAKGDVAFFLNSSLLAGCSGAVLAAHAIAHPSAPAWYVEAILCALPFALALLACRAAIGAAIRWGACVRASVDLHRRELYERLGIREPRSFRDERWIAYYVNATLLVGDPLPDKLIAPPAAAEPPADDGRRSWLERLLGQDAQHPATTTEEERT